MPNAGYPSTRAAVAEYLARKTGVPYTGDHVIMTVGAGGALNTVLKGLLDPGDEVIGLTPYFVEYRFYVSNHGGELVLVPTDDRFRPDPEKIAAAITPGPARSSSTRPTTRRAWSTTLPTSRPWPRS